MLPLPAAWAYEEGLPTETGIPVFWDSTTQLAVGQEMIQYIPSQPGTGQRSQFQFQGATQAPPVSQAGQSVGRGRGRGPQAGTSGVQGCVYTITQQFESADQPVIQGTFCYLAYRQECYLIMVRRIHSLLHQL